MDNNKITEQESLRIISEMINRARKEELGKWNFVSIYGIAGALLCLVAKIAGNGPWMWAWTAVPLLAWGLPWLFVRRRRRSATLFSSIAGRVSSGSWSWESCLPSPPCSATPTSS